jgi:hypothetical protein
METKKEIEELNKQVKYSINLTWLFEYSQEFRDVAKKCIIFKQKFYTVQQYCDKRKIVYDNPEDNNEKHNAMVKHLSEAFPGLYINPYEDIVCDLTIPLLIPKEETEYFNYFFHFRLLRLSLSEIDNFLEYQLGESFNNEFDTFSRYLILFLREYEDSLNKKISNSVLEWINIAKNKIIPKSSSKLKWSGKPQEVVNGFEYLMSLNCRKDKPYCSIKNIENFVYANFDFDNVEIPDYINNVYSFEWFADKHDFTVLMKKLKVKKIQSTNTEIKDFIQRVIPDSSPDSIMYYLKGDKLKQKFSIDTSRFN